MLDTLTNGFRAARHKLMGVAEINEENISDALRDVRMALLEADVDFKVAKDFLNKVKERLSGQILQLKSSGKAGQKMKVSPGEHFIKACYDELVQLMGPVDTSLEMPKKGLAVFMMVGLQGSGKTTTCAKLARFLEKTHQRKPLLVAADVYRPAAVEQLKVLGARLGYPVYFEEGVKDPPGICERAVLHAKMNGRDTVLLDTAGRLAIDEVLMEELSEIKKRVNPGNIFLVLDSMIGQDAVKTAKAFDDRLGITGSILTKLDGDARGGSALSVKTVTGRPIKFLGIGESLDKLEVFRPEGMAQRILGMGDVVGLVKDFEGVVDAEKAEEDAERMLAGKFDMADFLEQIRMIQKMGSLKDMIEKLPFFPDGLPKDIVLDDRELTRIEAIIHSMTTSERKKPDLFFQLPGDWLNRMKMKQAKKIPITFDDRRIARVARGCGRQDEDVRQLLIRFVTMRQIMGAMGQNRGLLSKIPGFKQLSQLKAMKELNMDELMSFTGMGGMGGPGPGDDPMGPGGPVKKRPQLSSAEKDKLKKKRKDSRKARKANKKK
ncbi:signal recognition particle protein Srp54 [Myxococcota bacterium]|nr:signal recognition particle protein Srp54 [Myxococcota bacterium]